MTLTLRTMNEHAQLMSWGDHWGKTISSSWTLQRLKKPNSPSSNAIWK
jgi:hypothetical protein